MKRFMKSRILFLVLILFLFATIILFGLKKYIDYGEEASIKRDAVQVIATDLASRRMNNVPLNNDEIRHVIMELARASVINIVIDKNGTPRDCFGNEFIISQSKEAVTVSTAGRDKLMEIRDDIKYICEIKNN